MTFFRGAILAGGVLLVLGPLAEPQFVRFELRDGAEVAGEMTAWDVDGIQGSFGQRSWSELVPGDLWRLYVTVMDQNDAHQWVDLGRLLLSGPDGDHWARRAFARALRLDETVEARIEAARAAAVETRRRRRELDRTAQEHRLDTRSPEADDWPADPWPPMGRDEQTAAGVELRSDVTQILRQAGLQLVPLETDHFLVWADLPSIDAARLATRLESVYERLAGMLGADRGGNRFWGKAVVLYFSDPDRLRLVEAESFGQLIERETLGICHPVGPKVFINLSGDTTGERFGDAAAQQVVHAYMHRFHAPMRLPVWANRGLADYVATTIAPGGSAERRRREALEYIRTGGDLAAVFNAGWTDPWPPAATAVGALMIELMVNQRPDGFRRWVIAAKSGKNWDAALAEDYGVRREHLLEILIQYYRVND